MQEIKAAKIILVCTNYFALRAFLIPLEAMLRDDYEVFIVAKLSDAELTSIQDEFGLEIQINRVPIERKPQVFADLWALVKLTVLIRRLAPDLVFTIMPKAGLLGMLASVFCGVRRRVHCFTGQVWVTKVGISRWIFRNLDKVIAALSTHVLADGRGQREFLIDQNVVSQQKISLVFNGSIAGIDVRGPELDARQRSAIRGQYGFSDQQILLLFMSRMTRDKGFNEVLYLFDFLSKLDERYALLLVGPDEDGLLRESRIDEHKNVVYVPYTKVASQVLQLCDVFLSPSHREGLPMTLLQALTFKRIVFVSNVYGNNDLVVHGVNGYLHNVGDVSELAGQVRAVTIGGQVPSDKNFADKIKTSYDRRSFGLHFRSYISNALLDP